MGAAVWRVLAKKVWKYNTEFKILVPWAWKHWLFWNKKNVWLVLYFDLFSNIMDQKSTRSQKSCWYKKSISSCLLPVNDEKEFLTSIHTEALFSQLFARVQIAPISFCLKINVPKLFQGFLITYYLVISGLIVDSPKVGMI